jgi:hypothetical protein
LATSNFSSFFYIISINFDFFKNIGITVVGELEISTPEWKMSFSPGVRNFTTTDVYFGWDLNVPCNKLSFIHTFSIEFDQLVHSRSSRTVSLSSDLQVDDTLWNINDLGDGLELHLSGQRYYCWESSDRNLICAKPRPLMHVQRSGVFFLAKRENKEVISKLWRRT